MDYSFGPTHIGPFTGAGHEILKRPHRPRSFFRPISIRLYKALRHFASPRKSYNIISFLKHDFILAAFVIFVSLTFWVYICFLIYRRIFWGF